jgi:Protein of unknown function (DUF1569)
MKSLADPAAQHEIESRFAHLAPTDTARWGSMSVHQMICHMTEAFRAALGEKPVALAPTRIPRRLMKCAALYIPRQWPHGFPSPPEIAQDKHGTPPIHFQHDHAALLAAFHDFCQRFPQQAPPHPYFGKLSKKEWQRWGYLHADHHLRQFAR